MAVLALALFLLLGTATAAEYKPLPWHLADYHHHLPEVSDFGTLSIDVDIRGKIGEGDFLFLAPLWGHIGRNSFYFGMQTDMIDDTHNRVVGRGLLFSRWGPATTADARAAAGGWSTALTDAKSREGDFTSVRRGYAWTPGRYTFRLTVQGSGTSGGQWLALSMEDHQTGRRVPVGSLRFEDGTPARFGTRPVSFVEVYRRPPGTVASQPYSPPPLAVTMGPLVVNDRIRPRGGQTYIGAKVPQVAKVTEEVAGVRITLANP
ncbi:MAG: hypothetical protein ABT940_07680 [Alphaproteobacteria bacterium]